ncbi:50S ribosomal protein L17 [Ligilactobacillus acidipiscis]|jgi:large subunit ribosomal protein L17|uniref:Large ribosomal subunit protein bL17 n=1 Tax=Ligilactobacillus acidipiscis TaxID=89059 RepID=A0A0R2KB06_9LACO|nr:50S ribosomal protein L17 [Ligilactobacillus acidipiscis]KRN84476.1 50S ribosomal protein L17P [Ligilactobacillus acidipiscis]MCI1924659.1 50S ribosomal protein L17 [Ligilactobacillus acidipiscis]MCI1953703.1 50S ribosomal protein L17 [Ligilactobacillus acidipiscis]SFV41149.1 LSU ribosomal protein L17p [Ligilactobacillus acidipiscis]HJE96482.1 50S ribosomal protein L17 [Ligilactobacillus acidipiscis]
MAYRKLGRDSAHRKAMLRNLTTDVIVNGKVVTTEPRAKEARKFVEKMITLGKKGDLAARRRAAAFMMDVVADVKEDEDKVVIQTALQKLFDEVAPRYAERNGGYTRILKMDQRRGDAAQMVVLELVD